MRVKAVVDTSANFGWLLRQLSLWEVTKRVGLLLVAGLWGPGMSLAETIAIPPDGPDQMPLIYVHGFNDDGTSWARGKHSDTDSPGKRAAIHTMWNYEYGTRPPLSASTMFSAEGIENWAVQWWSVNTNNAGLASGFTEAEEGYAFLQDAEELVTGTDWIRGTWSIQNRPVPSALNQILAADASYWGVPGAAPFWEAEGSNPIRNNIFRRARLAAGLLINNTYNDSGDSSEKGRDFLDLLRWERNYGRLQSWRQVNLITHSHGGLVTRNFLHQAREESRSDYEFISNVVYCAPPFAGSSLAHINEVFYGTTVFDKSAFADPYLNRLITVIPGGAARDVLDQLLQPFLLFNGIVRVDFERAIGPTARLAIEATDSVALGTANSLSDFAEPDSAVGEALAFAVNALRGVVGSFMGFPAEPAGLGELTPGGAADFLTEVSTIDEVNQYIAWGDGGPPMLVFPPDLEEVANDLTLLSEADAQEFSPGDNAVATGSAQLLTTTDRFGPRMKPLYRDFMEGSVFPFDHGEIITDAVDVMQRVWLNIYLAAPTTLILDGEPGEIATISSTNRRYGVSGASSFSFQSEAILRPREGFNIDVAAASHEYRVIPSGGNGEPSPWQAAPLGFSRDFAGLSEEFGLANQGFFLEWRSINQRGGQEMIRRAHLIIAAEAPQVADVLVISPDPAEVLESRPGRLLGAAARRTGLTGRLAALNPGQQTLLTQLLMVPEPRFTFSDPDTKALVVVFDQPGEVHYAWDDSSLADPVTLAGVNSLVLPLTGFAEGIHVLTFQTSRESQGGIVNTAPSQSLRILIDETPPSIAFSGNLDHGLGYLAGPNTPLLFTVEDVGSNRGDGEMAVPLHPNGPIPPNVPFTLGATGLQEQLEEVGAVGGFVTLQATARDGVNNVMTEEIEIYYDITPPTIELKEVVGALPDGEGGWRVFSSTVEVVVSISDQGAGGVAMPRLLVAGESEEGVSSTLELVRGAVPGHPDDYGATVTLANGTNCLVATALDLAENAGVLDLSIDFAQEVFDQEPVDLLSRRQDVPFCFNEEGEAVACTLGSVAQVDSSYHGDVFVFRSTGNHFVAGDTNGDADIFAWENGLIRRVSVRQDGTEGVGGQCDFPAVSGNGRYVVFRSNMTNLAEGVDPPRYNLYLKDRWTGELDVIVRDSSGRPANDSSQAFFDADITNNGRYIFFDSRSTDLVSGLVDDNNGSDIFVVDVDPDENGSFFDGNYEITPISNLEGQDQMANRASRSGVISRDGGQITFITQSSDLHPTLTSNSAGTRNAIIMEFSGSGDDGTLDVGDRRVQVLNYAHAFNGDALTANGVRYTTISPDGRQSAFATSSNLAGSQDANNESLGLDVYTSLFTGNFDTRFIAWASRAYAGEDIQSSTPVTQFRSLSMGMHEPIEEFAANKVAWVSGHNNLYENDTNGRDDLFIRINDSGRPRGDFPVINWIAADQPSGAHVTEGGVTPDGRYAWWVTRQSYVSPYSPTGSLNLYRRRLDPIVENAVTFEVEGGGVIDRSPLGGASGNPETFLYPDTARVQVTAMADPGWRFVGWQGVERPDESAGVVRTSHNRTVRAIFEAVDPPQAASAEIVLAQGSPGAAVAPIIEASPGQALTLSIVGQPNHGTAGTGGGLLFYQPNEGFAGPDSFLFQVTNEYGQSLAAPATCVVTVEAANVPPAESSLLVEATEGVAGGGLVPEINDPTTGETFTFTVLTKPTHGSVEVVDGTFRYAPNPGYTGEDFFTYRATDSAGGTVVGTAEVVVRPAGVSMNGMIERVFRDGEGRFSVSFPSMTGMTYYLESKTHLADPLWNPVSAVPGNGEVMTLQDGGVFHARRFYRLRRSFR